MGHAGQPRRGGIGGRTVIALVCLIALAGASVGAWYAFHAAPDRPVPPPAPVEAADLPEKVHRLCGECHAYPPADTFPRFAWKKEVELGYSFFEKSKLEITPPPI